MVADKSGPGWAERGKNALLERVFELKRRLAGAKPPREFTADWYAGLCAEPSDFTGQLIRLQEVLRNAGKAVPADDELEAGVRETRGGRRVRRSAR